MEKSRLGAAGHGLRRRAPSGVRVSRKPFVVDLERRRSGDRHRSLDAQRRDLPSLRWSGRPRHPRPRRPRHPVRETAASPATGSVPRPAWRRERETGDEAPGLLEDLVGAQDLADLMDARHTPATHAGWPVRRSQGDPDMTIVCPIEGGGWNHLLRAGLAVLLPLECPGVAPPWRAGQIKERLGRLKIHHRRHTPFYEGIGAILSDVSATTCIYCGRPGRMRRPGWMHPACDNAGLSNSVTPSW